MITWSTEKPYGEIILAKIRDDWGWGREYYTLLYYNDKYYYDDGGEEIPIDMIEKWALVKA